MWIIKIIGSTILLASNVGVLWLLWGWYFTQIMPRQLPVCVGIVLLNFLLRGLNLADMKTLHDSTKEELKVFAIVGWFASAILVPAMVLLWGYILHLVLR